MIKKIQAQILAASHKCTESIW